MKVIDLTHAIEPGMPVYPGTEPPTFEPAKLEIIKAIETRLNNFDSIP